MKLQRKQNIRHVNKFNTISIHHDKYVTHLYLYETNFY